MELKSKKNFFTFSIYIIVGFGLIGLSFFFITAPFEDQNTEITTLLIGVIPSIIGLILISRVLLSEQFEINNDKFIISDVFGNSKKEFFLKDIKNYSLIIRRLKRGISEELVIFFNNDKVKIHSGLISNFNEFKSIITKGKKINFEYTKERNLRYNRILGTSFILVGLMSLSSYFFIDFSKTNLSEVLVDFWYVLFLWLAFILYGIYLIFYKDK